MRVDAADAADASLRAAGAAAERREAQLASACAVLLQRYGVLFRDLLEREANVPKWRELLPMLRRMEGRGEVRGGRFISGFAGEQFALPAALQSLREARREGLRLDLDVSVAAADPLNLLGVVIPGERVPAVAGKSVGWTYSLLSSNTARLLEEPRTLQTGIFANGEEGLRPQA